MNRKVSQCLPLLTFIVTRCSRSIALSIWRITPSLLCHSLPNPAPLLSWYAFISPSCLYSPHGELRVHCVSFAGTWASVHVCLCVHTQCATKKSQGNHTHTHTQSDILCYYPTISRGIIRPDLLLWIHNITGLINVCVFSCALHRGWCRSESKWWLLRLLVISEQKVIMSSLALLRPSFSSLSSRFLHTSPPVPQFLSCHFWTLIQFVLTHLPLLFFFFLCLLCISPFSNFPPSLISCPLIRSRSPSLFPFRFISFAVHRIVKNDASDEQKNNTQPVKHVIISLSVNISMCWDFYFCLVVNLKKLKYKE